MLDIHFIRENADVIKEGARKKHIDIDIDRLIAVDDERKALRTELDSKRAEQNRASFNIVNIQGEEKNKLLESLKFLKESMSELEEKLTKVMEEWQKLMLSVPNIPDMTVPEGESDADNVEIRTWGEIPT
ncbi:MAG: serine--tRNA ligase, partial [Candidatus Pacebacteria bacterium]|nr:serine--tRNA ligase [Candidatus Paceibacterota bacterium]